MQDFETKTIVVLGAGWAGITLTHQLLKHVLPKVPELRVVLVSPNTHFFWNIAAPRGIIPNTLTDDELFVPIAPAFAKYPPTAFEFVLATAETIEPQSNTVTVRLGDCEAAKLCDGEDLREIAYDQLVVAIGSRVFHNLPLKAVGNHAETLAALHDLQAKIASARSIVVGGAGPTATQNVRVTAEKDLLKLGVKIIHHNRAEKSEDGDKRAIHLSRGGTIYADLFLPLYGVVVNNACIPQEFLDWEGNLKLDQTLRVQGTQNIWGIGDVGNVEVKLLVALEGQTGHLINALEAVLTGVGSSMEVYHPTNKTIIFFCFGRWRASGQIGNWKIPGFFVSMFKGRRLFVDNAQSYVNGKTRQPAA
uniref:FAD/NAD(P)-binding domain-containing protein n=1 Tax=Bionectria ochroleuca TaxID=29856 RepID=A0A0B7JVS0_BIOOC